MPHIDGIPFRKLANENKISPASAYLNVLAEMDRLPENTWLSARYCDRWSGRLVVDGKHIAVKGYDKKVPFIYGVDFLTHDIPVGILVPSENEVAFTKFFGLLKQIQYHLQIVIGDDTTALKPALQQVFPTVPIQLCHNHYLENIRQLLLIRTEEKYCPFFNELRQIFSHEVHHYHRLAWLRRLFFLYGKREAVIQSILVDIARRYDELFAFDAHFMKRCPRTTNLIESYNSHLQARLKSIKGFQNFHSAQRWLNAWMIRRRTKPFTDCQDPFKHLNGLMPIQKSIKKDAQVASILKLIYS